MTHSNLKNQMPEAQVISEGRNGSYFKEDNIDDLVEKIELWLDTQTNRELVREECYKVIDNYYNPNYQIKVFRRVFSGCKPEM
jgi:glycosyltransferase involved in cell wall biosynthesis